MIAKHQELKKAVSYLDEELRIRAHGRLAHLTWYSVRQQLRRNEVVDPRHLCAGLEHFGQHFPEATVIIEPDCGRFVVGALQCRCDAARRRTCPFQCRHREERPLISVILSDPHDPPTEEEKHDVLRALFRSMHAQEVVHRNGKDSQHETPHGSATLRRSSRSEGATSKGFFRTLIHR